MAQRSSLVQGFGGYLEKNSGLMKSKIKYWCMLEGTTMLLSRENKRSSGFESVNLTDAQTVRKVNSNKSGTQFEIVMKKNKKSHIFTALSPEECSTWIQKLQCLMIAKSPADVGRSSQFFVDDSGGYTSIDTLDSSDPVKMSQNETFTGTKSTAAATTTTTTKTTTTTTRASETMEGEYAEIGEAYLSQERSSTKTKTKTNNNENETKNASFSKPSNSGLVSEYAPADLLTEENYSDVVSAEEPKPHSPAVTDLYASVNKEQKRKDSTEDSTDEVLSLFDKLEFTKPAPLIPLQDEDYKPLRDLKQFLANNEDLCRRSYNIVPQGADPVLQLKEMLKEIG